MKYDSFLVELSTNPLYLFLFFLFVLSLLHIVLIFLMKVDDVGWKKIDYIWLSATGLGLLAASAQADTFLSRVYLENSITPSTKQQYQMLRFGITEVASKGVFACRTFTRSVASPDDFDKTVEEYRKLCEQVKVLNNTLPSKVSSPFPSLQELGYKQLEGDRNYVAWELEQLESYAQNYHDAQSRWSEFYDSSQKSGWETFFTILGPLLLSLALALRITKVSGELSNSNGKKIT